MQELGGIHLGRSRMAFSAPRLGVAPPPDATTVVSPTLAAWPAELSRVIEADILPRLMLAYMQPPPVSPPRSAAPVAPVSIEDFADRLAANDIATASDFIAAIQREGKSRHDIFLEILAPAARRLGSLWETDHCDFVEVTVGLRGLQDIMRRLSEESEAPVREAVDSPQALFLPAPGETHLFGVAMVESFFRDAGWQVRRGDADFAETLSGEWFDVVGFSLSCARHVDALGAAVRSAREASRNSSIFVLVGGPIFVDDVALVAKVGADATAVDAPRAVLLARTLLRERARNLT
jgi:methanogenic corrinoid protein MtbC1